jgi:alpha-tubulin suppressor-like RCC1 family protein
MHPNGTKIIQLCCGFSHSGFVNEKQRLFMSGSNDYGQLGIDNSLQDLSTFTAVPSINEPIQKVACGYYHSMALLENGDLLSWGSATNGQTGHGNSIDQSLPKLIDTLSGKTIKNIACGAFHSVALTDLQNVYCWGRGSKGRLGLNSDSDQFSPRLIEPLLGKQIVDISCGHCHTVALTQMGTLYIWGDSQHGKVISNK